MQDDCTSQKNVQESILLSVFSSSLSLIWSKLVFSSCRHMDFCLIYMILMHWDTDALAFSETQKSQ